MIDFRRVFRDGENVERINVRGLIVGNVEKTTTRCSLCIIVCRAYTWRPYILLYAGDIHSYMPVLHTLICRSYILLNVSPLYSNMSMLYTVICQLPTLSYSDMPALYTVIFRCFQCDMVVYRRGRHCHTWVHTTDSLWMANQNTFLFLLLDTFYFKTINIWLV
jgi:hypothetical protein